MVDLLLWDCGSVRERRRAVCAALGDTSFLMRAAFSYRRHALEHVDACGEGWDDGAGAPSREGVWKPGSRLDTTCRDRAYAAYTLRGRRCQRMMPVWPSEYRPGWG
jgi:hypothetical protein